MIYKGKPLLLLVTAVATEIKINACNQEVNSESIRMSAINTYESSL